MKTLFLPKSLHAKPAFSLHEWVVVVVVVVVHARSCPVEDHPPQGPRRRVIYTLYYDG